MDGFHIVAPGFNPGTGMGNSHQFEHKPAMDGFYIVAPGFNPGTGMI